MARQDYNLQLTRYDERGWRATFSSGAQFDQTGLGALVDHADRFVCVSGWPWRTLRGMLRKARPGA
jgi:hypothetical protein